MAKAGPSYECLWADVGSYGRNNDGGVWNKSALHKGIEDGTIKLPESDALPGNVGHITPYVFLGDDALKT